MITTMKSTSPTLPLRPPGQLLLLPALTPPHQHLPRSLQLPPQLRQLQHPGQPRMLALSTRHGLAISTTARTPGRNSVGWRTLERSISSLIKLRSHWWYGFSREWSLSKPSVPSLDGCRRSGDLVKMPSCVKLPVSGRIQRLSKSTVKTPMAGGGGTHLSLTIHTLSFLEASTSSLSLVFKARPCQTSLSSSALQKSQTGTSWAGTATRQLAPPPRHLEVFPGSRQNPFDIHFNHLPNSLHRLT